MTEEQLRSLLNTAMVGLLAISDGSVADHKRFATLTLADLDRQARGYEPHESAMRFKAAFDAARQRMGVEEHELWRVDEKLGEFTAWEACQFLAKPEKTRKAWKGIINQS